VAATSRIKSSIDGDVSRAVFSFDFIFGCVGGVGFFYAAVVENFIPDLFIVRRVAA